MTPRRLLLISYYFPPSTAIGGARWAAMARHLRALGHHVTVITSAAHGRPRDDDDDVLRTPDLVASDALRHLLRRPPLPEAGGTVPDTPAPGILTRVLVPDSHLVSWVPGALAAARRTIRQHEIDCVITSGPPDSAHLAALALGRARPAWIVDLRDGWLFEPLAQPWPTAPQRALDRMLERTVVRTAQVAIGATRPIADDLTQRLGANARWVPNGWDPQVDAVAAPDVGEPGWVTLAHTGTLSGPRGRDPRPLFEGIRRVNAGDGPRVRLVLAGRITTEDERLLAEAGLGDAVRHLGLLERGASLGLQRAADGLLLLTGVHASEATGKLFEYLAAGRPIVALAHGNEAARIVEATGTGIVVPPFDAEAIARALRQLAAGTVPYAPHGLEPFTYPGPAETVAALVEDAIRERASARSRAAHRRRPAR